MKIADLSTLDFIAYRHWCLSLNSKPKTRRANSRIVRKLLRGRKVIEAEK